MSLRCGLKHNISVLIRMKSKDKREGMVDRIEKGNDFRDHLLS